MSQDINSLTLRYVEKSSNVMQLATKLAKDAVEQQDAAKGKVAAVVGHLKKAGLIDEHEEKLASEQLSKSASALDVLNNVVTEYSKLQAKVASVELGKAASDTSNDSDRGGAQNCHHKNANYVGYIRGAGETSARDRSLLALINR